MSSIKVAGESSLLYRSEGNSQQRQCLKKKIKGGRGWACKWKLPLFLMCLVLHICLWLPVSIESKMNSCKIIKLICKSQGLINLTNAVNTDEICTAK